MVSSVISKSKLWREETISPCPCPRCGYLWRLNTFITRLDFKLHLKRQGQSQFTIPSLSGLQHGFTLLSNCKISDLSVKFKTQAYTPGSVVICKYNACGCIESDVDYIKMSFYRSLNMLLYDFTSLYSTIVLK